jgi:hypothetical protein
MNKYLYLLLFLLLLPKAESHAQSKSYIVKSAPFSSGIYDEFSPVYYKGGIVFCSDRNDNSIVGYKNDQNRLFKIFYAGRRGTSGWSPSRILSKEISTFFNDGPATFNEEGTLIYYSRNNSVINSLKNINDTTNKLGIYSAELINGIWTNIKPFIYNNPLYSLCTPALTPDGERIYFSSDIPGGFGGMDLYYCDRHNNEWTNPVNLGPGINTLKNESFPYACKYGKLYFASDGHNSIGGKDLFYTQEINGDWIVPVHLDSAINSTADDFGLVVDTTFENGFFSTNRRNSDDIFSFSSAPVEFSECDSIRQNKYCFTFYDEQHRLIDTIQAIYVWDFGNGDMQKGIEVRHCFPGPGKYIVKLNIIDELTGDSISKKVEYNVDLENIKQAVIKADDTGIANQPISFEGILTDLKGITITDLFWNFGEGFKEGGQVMTHTFIKRGEYTVQMGLLSQKDSQGVIQKICVMKKLKIN